MSAPPTKKKASPTAGSSGWWSRLFRRSSPRREPVNFVDADPTVLLDIAAESILRCGFEPEDFRIKVLPRSARLQGLTLIVQVTVRNPVVWTHASHLETYVINRILRHAGYEVARILFVPVQVTGIKISDAHNAVRTVWSSFQALRPGRATPPELTDPGRQDRFQPTGYSGIEHGPEQGRADPEDRLAQLMQVHDAALAANRKARRDLQAPASSPDNKT